MKKKLALVLALVLMAALFTGCGSKGNTLASVQKSGKLTIATSPDFPPFESLDENNNPIGIEIELLQLIADEFGVKLDIQQMDFDSVLPGVQAGKFTVGVSGISVTEERQKNTVFTTPYCLAAQAIVVVEGSPITCKADLTGKSVSVQTATTAEAFTMGEGYKVNSYSANSDAELALVTGKVDAWVIDDLTAKEMVDAYNAENEVKLVVLGDAMTTEPYAFALKLGDEALAEEMNKVIDKLVANGTVAALFEKYDAPYTAPTK